MIAEAEDLVQIAPNIEHNLNSIVGCRKRINKLSRVEKGACPPGWFVFSLAAERKPTVIAYHEASPYQVDAPVSGI